MERSSRSFALSLLLATCMLSLAVIVGCESRTVSAGRAGNAEDGQRLFEANCASCHGDLGASNPQVEGASDLAGANPAGIETHLKSGEHAGPSADDLDFTLQEFADLGAFFAQVSGEGEQDECDPPCRDDEECANGECVPAVVPEDCDPPCVDDEECVNGECVPAVVPEECDPPCADDEECVNGECVPAVLPEECDPPCADDEECVNGECVPAVVPEECDPPCADDEECVDGECVPLEVPVNDDLEGTDAEGNPLAQNPDGTAADFDNLTLCHVITLTPPDPTAEPQ